MSVLAPPETTAKHATSPFPPIADYAFLSDCATTALIAPDGAVEWMCLPRPDSPSVFSTLLDRSAGFFRFGPAHAHVPSQRRYVAGTVVLETTWSTATGWLVVRDALVMGPWHGHERVEGVRRPPADVTGRQTLLRTAKCISGQVDLMVDCMPLFDYGRSAGAWSYHGTGYDVASCKRADQPELILSSSLRLVMGGARATTRTGLSGGDTAVGGVGLTGRDVADKPEPRPVRAGALVSRCGQVRPAADRRAIPVRAARCRAPGPRWRRR